MQRKEEKETEQSIQELCNNFRKYNIHIIRILEIKWRMEEKIIEVILLRTFQN